MAEMTESEWVEFKRQLSWDVFRTIRDAGPINGMMIAENLKRSNGAVGGACGDLFKRGLIEIQRGEGLRWQLTTEGGCRFVDNTEIPTGW